ncbi:hypothetical protein GQ607_005292 [Colletotrichum asianum]|uniref:deoxyribose-phosphate aldolase n=1 Tax=Colletotrichum asianum TaxID=702518 RepID=A0A8H3ZUV3_9PEZI|nr:hypothetical protein GQ607_005292 [Colletotrichum asianum]
MTLGQVAKMIDHSLLHPTMTDTDILEGLRIAKKYNVATACVKPYLIPLAKSELEGSDVLVCPVISFPHSNSTTEVKVFEAKGAAHNGGKEIDIDYVAKEIRKINEAVVKHSAILKVIFENNYLQEKHIIQLCEICSDISVSFVKTSTGYGFVKQPNRLYTYAGATVPHLKLMRQHSKPEVQVKAAGGVRTLDDLLHVMSLGVTRIGATATIAIMEAAVARGITDKPTTVEFKPISDAAPDIPEDSAQMARSDLGFCEDPLVTQALLDFEQAMSYDPNGVLGGGLAEFGDPFVESCFGAHDQGWIWNPRN